MKNTVWVIIKSLIGLLFLIVLISIANFIPISNFYFVKIVEFINANLLVIILFTILFFLGEIFYLFGFPISLPAPIFQAYASYFLAGFIFKILYLVDELTGKELLLIFKNVESVTLILVFVLVLIFGFLKILTKNNRGVSKERKEIGWGDIGNEFKEGLYNLTVAFKQSLKPKDKKPGRTKKKR
jgi:ABC-type multidrug transport system fused ATPase/permease subunit